MKTIELCKLSSKYKIRKLDMNDVDMIYLFCRCNTQFYEYCGHENSIELIQSDLKITPPGNSSGTKVLYRFF